MGRTTLLAAACAAVAFMTVAATAPGAGAADPAPRVDLRVLVVDDRGPATAAIAAELDSSGTPFTTVDLTDSGRRRIDEGFLSDTVDGRPRARFQAVVLPNDNPFAAGSTEMTALATYEKRFGIRQVDAYTYARPAVGLNVAEDNGYSGPLDGRAARTTAAGAAGPFGYLDGAVPFEDNDTQVTESYGYAAVPLAQQADGATFTPYVDTAVTGGARGSLVGEYAHDGRRELVVTFAYNQYQRQFRLLARGIVEWMTQGIHLGADHNYLTVHVDDVLAADDRWDSDRNCTPGDVDCTGDNEDTAPIRMTPEDARYAEQWSADHGITLDFAYNAGGSESYKEDNDGSDPLATQLLADRNSFRWLNHTYDHPFLGCEQNVTVVPWRCSTDLFGRTRWVSTTTITGQIDENLAWADRNGLTVDRSELVTGEHSGLKTLPQQPSDNPNLATALGRGGIGWLASDRSRESAQRAAGPALTVPRYPMNIFYNAGRTAEQVDEYNWIYGRKADGGSGICETAGNSTCLPAPLDPRTGYAAYIVPLESRIALGHVLANDPLPHFIHQSNLAEDRIAYPALEKILGDYADYFADSTPTVGLRMKDAGEELRRRAAWDKAVDAGQVTAYRVGGTVTVNAPSGVRVPATLPPGTQQGQNEFGSAYAGRRSGWAVADAGQSGLVLTLPDAATPTDPSAAATARVPTPAHRPTIPAGTSTAVPYGPGDTARS